MGDRANAEMVQTGFPEIDLQHQTLIEKVNHLIAGILTGQDNEVTLTAFDELGKYWQLHCHSEESILESQGSRRIAVMNAEHDRILRRIEGFRQAFADDPEAFRSGTDVGEIRRLALRHFKQYDKVEFRGLSPSA